MWLGAAWLVLCDPHTGPRVPRQSSVADAPAPAPACPCPRPRPRPPPPSGPLTPTLLGLRPATSRCAKVLGGWSSDPSTPCCVHAALHWAVHRLLMRYRVPGIRLWERGVPPVPGCPNTAACVVLPTHRSSRPPAFVGCGRARARGRQPMSSPASAPAKWATDANAAGAPPCYITVRQSARRLVFGPFHALLRCTLRCTRRCIGRCIGCLCAVACRGKGGCPRVPGCPNTVKDLRRPRPLWFGAAWLGLRDPHTGPRVLRHSSAADAPVPAPACPQASAADQRMSRRFRAPRRQRLPTPPPAKIVVCSRARTLAGCRLVGVGKPSDG